MLRGLTLHGPGDPLPPPPSPNGREVGDSKQGHCNAECGEAALGERVGGVRFVPGPDTNPPGMAACLLVS